MPRLPIPGGDENNWSNIINEFLRAIHKEDGTLKDDVVSADNIDDSDVVAIAALLNVYTEVEADTASADIATAIATALVDDLSGVTDPATARTNLDIYSISEVDALIDALLDPVGSLRLVPFSTPPSGTLECDGSSLDTTTYAALFAEIGYESGGAGANFNIPDYRGEFLRGWDHGAGNDPDAGSRTDRGDATTGDNVGTKQADQYESHDHGLVQAAHPDTFVSTAIVPGNATSWPNAVAHDWNEGGNETRPRNVNIMYCIKY